ncbi:MAG: TIGR01777 family oxidoreductase [Bacteroidetes bacterium]|nr:TIGR01777 family oxidoreductase [Bacteroidota bacterium]
MKTIGITGGTGFVGKHLSKLLLSKGYELIIFTRHPKPSEKQNLTYAAWDPEKGTCDANALQKLDAAIHLAGAGIADKRWTETRKQEIVNSRVQGTKFLVSMLRQHAPNCKTLVSASAIGYYGPDRDGTPPFKETNVYYNDFLGNTCYKWEHEARAAEDIMRTIIFRFGIVLGKESGAFPQFAGPQSFGIVPILGSGRQVVSWIEVDDLARMITYALEHTDMKGSYNAVAPNPVTHKTLMKTIARTKGGIKIPIPVPSFALKIALGEMSEEVLKSCTVSAQKIQATGFTFQYDTIDKAVKAILKDQ